jgi:hypothetical protein
MISVVSQCGSAWSVTTVAAFSISEDLNDPRMLASGALSPGDARHESVRCTARSTIRKIRMDGEQRLWQTETLDRGVNGVRSGHLDHCSVHM